LIFKEKKNMTPAEKETRGSIIFANFAIGKKEHTHEN
jgi:hypothetical protein